MALSDRCVFLLKTYAAELRQRALADGAYDPKAMEIVDFLIHDQRRDQLAAEQLDGDRRESRR